MAKSNGSTRRGNANSPNGLSSSANSVENFMSELGLKLSSEAPRDGVLGEVDSYIGEIKPSDKTKELIASALAKSGTNKELTKEEGDALHTLLHEIGHFSATKERGMDSEGGVLFGSGIDKVSEVMNNIWADGNLRSFAAKYGMKIPKNYTPKDDAYRRLQGKLDRVMDILGVDKKAVYSDIANDKVSYVGYLGRTGKNQDHNGLAAVIARHSGGRISQNIAKDIIDNVAANSRDNEYLRKDEEKYSGKRAARIINEDGLAKHKVYDYMFIARSDFENGKRYPPFTPAQKKKYNQF